MQFRLEHGEAVCEEVEVIGGCMLVMVMVDCSIWEALCVCVCVGGDIWLEVY